MAKGKTISIADLHERMAQGAEVEHERPDPIVIDGLEDVIAQVKQLVAVNESLIEQNNKLLSSIVSIVSTKESQDLGPLVESIKLLIPKPVNVNVPSKKFPTLKFHRNARGLLTEVEPIENG